MAALPPVSKVVRVDFFQTYGANTRVRDRIFLQYSGAMSSADLATVLSNIDTAWNNNMTNLQNVGTTLTSIMGTDLSSNTAPQVVRATNRVGTRPAPGLPAGSAFVIRFKLARRYRGGHPRFYIVGGSSGDVQNGDQLTPAAIGAYQVGFGAFIGASVAAPPAAVGTLVHVNVHYFSGFHNVTFPTTGRVRSVPTALAVPTVDTVLSYSTNPLVASQRRRNQQSV
jgi:hypothetical protein